MFKCLKSGDRILSSLYQILMYLEIARYLQFLLSCSLSRLGCPVYVSSVLVSRVVVNVTCEYWSRGYIGC